MGTPRYRPNKADNKGDTKRATAARYTRVLLHAQELPAAVAVVVAVVENVVVELKGLQSVQCVGREAHGKLHPKSDRVLHQQNWKQKTQKKPVDQIQL